MLDLLIIKIMSRKCDITGKKVMFGGNRKHRRGSSGGGGVWRFKAQRTAKSWRPNLRKTKLVDTNTGTTATYKISMKAYKKLRSGDTLDNFVLA
jgi:ribosomal protein L28